VGVAVVLVVSTTATLVAVGVDLAIAVLALLLAVALASVLGFTPGIAAAIVAFGALGYYFTPPLHSFAVDSVDDLVALFTFVAVSAAVAALVARLNDLRRRAELAARAELDRSRAEFLTAVTHDLRTPLATIKGAITALMAPASRPEHSERRELLDAAYEETSRLEVLVTKVLELTRIRALALEPEPVAVGAADVTRAAVDRLRESARGRDIVLDIGDELPELWVDPVMMEHVIVNLLENALRYEPPGRGVEVRAGNRQSEVEILVVDHGPGIPASARARVFDEFVQLENRSGNGGGAGLGLAIVRGLVEANHGRVWCEETPGGGATFGVALPADRAAVAT